MRSRDGRLLHESKHFCVEFQRNFAELYGAHCSLEAEVNFLSYNDGMLRPLTRDGEFCKMPRTPEDIREAWQLHERGAAEIESYAFRALYTYFRFVS